MFVSYELNNYGSNSKYTEYGFMTFKENTLTEIDGFLSEILWNREHKIIAICNYTSYDKNYVHFHNDGIYRTIKYDAPLKDVEDVNKLYTTLHDEYGFTNILSFLPITK